VPASVPWVRLIARPGGSAVRKAPDSIASTSVETAILPSTVGSGTLRALPPDQNSVPPHSLACRCEISAQ
jgi:hypothetical protein